MNISKKMLTTLILSVILAFTADASAQGNYENSISNLKHRDYKIRAEAAFILGRTGGSNAVPSLIDALNDKNALVRQKVAGALGKIADERAVIHLVKLLSDPDRNVRMISGAGLQLIGAPSVIPLMREAERSDKETQRLIAFTLGLIKDKRALILLGKLARAKDVNVQWSAIWAMGETGDISSVKVITEIVEKSNSSFLQIKGIEALEKIGGNEAEVSIREFISSGSIKVRREAARSLNRMKK